LVEVAWPLGYVDNLGFNDKIYSKLLDAIESGVPVMGAGV
jgi:hypothetical protein